MELTAALTTVAAHTGLNAEKLMEYADAYQGDNERAFLYAIVRALRPRFALELGTHTGEGATCILQAITDGQYGVHLTTVDILDEPHIGSVIPIGLRQYVTLVTANIDEWIADKSGYDFIFDDGSHSIHQVHQIYGRLEQLLNPGGIILSHDAAAGGVGDYIREGQTKSGYDLPVFIIDPAPWGFSVYRKPGWDAQGVGQSPAEGNEVAPAQLPEPEVINRAELLELSMMPDGTVEGTWIISREGSDLDAIIHEPVIIEPEDLPPAQPATEEFVDGLKDPAGVKKITKKRSPAKNPRTRKGSTK